MRAAALRAAAAFRRFDGFDSFSGRHAAGHDARAASTAAMSALAACARTGDDEARRKATMRPFAPDAAASGAGGRVRDVCAMCAPARVKIKESFE